VATGIRPSEPPGWIWAGLGMFVVGLLMSVGAVVVILLIGRGASRDPTTG
jgi:hypothetical protein